MSKRLGSLVFVLVLWGLASCSGPLAPTAVGGILDLRNRDWQSGPVELNGTWNLDGEPRTVPGTWEGAGSGTYRLRVLVSPGAPALALLSSSSAQRTSSIASERQRSRRQGESGPAA